jgi:hypothetical protein
MQEILCLGKGALTLTKGYEISKKFKTLHKGSQESFNKKKSTLKVP